MLIDQNTQCTLTINCCVIPTFQIVAATTQGVPQSVPPPSITAPRTDALRLSWGAPEKPRGIIKEYRLRQVGEGLIYSGTTDRRQHTVTGNTHCKSLSLWLGGPCLPGVSVWCMRSLQKDAFSWHMVRAHLPARTGEPTLAAISHNSR